LILCGLAGFFEEYVPVFLVGYYVSGLDFHYRGDRNYSRTSDVFVLQDVRGLYKKTYDDRDCHTAIHNLRGQK